jgi:glyceraldehyde-3-phosphate dehydrogenase (NADP+)
MKERAGKKKVVLELGGNAAVIIDQTADVDWAVKRILVGGFSYAGQSCISVQRIFVHEAVAGAFREKLLAGLKLLKVGDPLDTTTDIGPMVDEANARRVQGWVDEAVSMGGSLLAGGKANGAWFEPTVLEGVPPTANVCSNEAFAPLVVLATFNDFESAIAQVNDSDFGLQTGVFTNDLTHAWQAFNELEVGGVVMNDISSYRVDHMPYGGVKDSGLGREGLRWSIEDMTELRILVLASPQ